MDHKIHHVIVVGGGIGGLTTAIALAQRGHSVDVLERAGELRALGAGLTLQINAVKALSRLGIMQAVMSAGQVMKHASLLTWTGDVISQTDLERLATSIGAPSVGIHRAALQQTLVEALGTARLHLGVEVRGFVQDEKSATLILGDGSKRSADVVIGADGIHSALRAQLHGKREPEYAGYTCWRGVCENTGIIEPTRVSESWGDAQRFGLVPIGQGRLYWFAVADAPPGHHDGPDVKAELHERFAGWHSEVGRTIEATPASSIMRNDIADRKTLHPWGQGRVTLLGDAAHPMTPNLGQGACMAIEDAVVLAGALHELPDPEAALRLYEARRQERTDTVVNTARRFGRLGQWSSSLGRAIRDTMLHAMPDFVTERQLRWLYDFNC